MYGIICVEGYQAFRGTMFVDWPNGKSEKIFGEWLYRPDTGFWYCGGSSYPKEICRIASVV